MPSMHYTIIFSKTFLVRVQGPLHYFFRLWVGDLCSILKYTLVVYVWSLVNAGVDRYDDPSQHVRRPAPTRWFDNK